MALKPDRPGHFIREWRKAKGKTLEQLAERIGMTHQNLGKIERGKVPYNQTLLELLAVELGVEVASLIMRNPAAKDPFWSIWDQAAPLPERQQERVAERVADFVEGMKTGTEG